MDILLIRRRLRTQVSTLKALTTRNYVQRDIQKKNWLQVLKLCPRIVNRPSIDVD
jgi:hypothetical protein